MGQLSSVEEGEFAIQQIFSDLAKTKRVGEAIAHNVYALSSEIITRWNCGDQSASEELVRLAKIIRWATEKAEFFMREMLSSMKND